MNNPQENLHTLLNPNPGTSQPWQLNKIDQNKANDQLFSIIFDENVTLDEKLKKIQIVLNNGADVNARDVYDDNNTPLHKAVIIGEPEVVKLLLENGADINIKNDKNKECFNTDKYLKGKEIVEILTKCINKLGAQADRNVGQSPEMNMTSACLQPDQTFNKNKTKLRYKRIPGSSGIKGQYYETKLLMLVLTRLLNNQEVEEFYLASNMDGLGAFDDLVIKYKTRCHEKTKIIFVQTKHKENLKASITNQSLTSKKFNLKKYFDCYLQIRNKFDSNQECNDVLFKDRYEDVDCEFIIFTSRPSTQLLSKSENICVYDLLYTIPEGKVVVDNSSNPVILLVDDDNEKYYEDFLNRFKFYTNQGKENVVEKIVKNYIDKHYNTVKDINSIEFRQQTDVVFAIAHEEIVNWWKAIRGSYLTKNCTFLNKARSIVRDSPVKALNYSYIAKLENYAIEFDLDIHECFGLEVVTKTEDKFIIVETTETTLCSIKVFQYFKEKIGANRYLFLDLSAPGADLELISSELKEITVDTLVIVCKENENKTSLFQKLKTITEEYKNKIILIVDNISLEEFNIFDTKIKLTDHKNGYMHLTPKSRDSLNERTICYQGQELSLGTLIDKRCEHLIHSKILFAIINGEKIKIGKPIQSDAYVKKNVCRYYISRNINRCIKLQLNENINEEFFVVKKVQPEVQPHSSPHSNQDIITTYDINSGTSQFIENTYSNHNIHWFQEEGTDFVWKRSKGDLNRLIPYVIREPPSPGIRVPTNEPETILDIEENIVIISAEPGMGKSSLISHITMNTKQKYPSMWIIRINLRDYTVKFKMWGENKKGINETEAVKFLYNVTQLEPHSNNEKEANDQNNDDFVQFLSEMSSSQISFIINGDLLEVTESKLLEIKLFLYFYNEGKVMLLIDGFDEIYPEYKEEVILLLKTLQNSKIGRLWVTTRSYDMETILENKLSTFSYALEPLSHDDQKKLLTALWKEKIEPEKYNDRLNKYVNAFLINMSDMINDIKNSFTGVPLHIDMIAEIFYKEVMEDLEKSSGDPIHQMFSIDTAVISNILNLVTLYRRFVHTKFHKIRFGEKISPNFSTRSGMQDLIDGQYSQFLNDHKKMAAVSIYGLHRLKNICSKSEIDTLEKLVSDSLKDEYMRIGIIDRIIDVPKFFHLTYAEYFAAEYISDKLKSTPFRKSIWKFLFNTVLISSEPGVRIFIDSIFADSEFADLINHENIKKTVFELLKAKREYVTTYVILCSFSLPLPTSTALYVAINEGMVHIAKFLIRSIKGSLNKNNLNEFIKTITDRCRFSCVLCAAVITNNTEIINDLIENIKSVDAAKWTHVLECDDLPRRNPIYYAGFIDAFSINKDVIHILLKDLDPDDIERVLNIEIAFDKLYPTTLLHLGASKISSDIAIFLPYLKKLSKRQLYKLFFATDPLGRLPAHKAALSKNFEFFSISESLLTKYQFKAMCGTSDCHGFTALDFLECLRLDENYEEKRTVLIIKFNQSLSNDID